MPLDRVAIFILAFVFVLIPVHAMLMGSMGMRSRIETLMWIAPFVSIILISRHRLHLYLMLAALASSIDLPRVIGYRPMPLLLVVPLLVFAGTLARAAIGHRAKGHTSRVDDAAMLVVSAMVIGWLAIDRPGMGSMGSATGGAWEAMFAVSGVSAYWGLRSLRGSELPWQKLSLVILLSGIAGVLWTMVLVTRKGWTPAHLVMAGFEHSGWFVYGIALGIAVKILARQERPLRMLPVYGISASLMTNAVLSGFRSRIAFGPAMVMSALWAGAMRLRMAFWIAVAAIVTIMLANSQAYYDMPLVGQRVLSVVQFGSHRLRKIPGLGEVGRQSPWRQELWSLAWRKVKERPISGYGYALDTSALMADMSSAGSVYEARIRSVASAGQFHSLPLNAMYFLGIPVALCLFWVWAAALRRIAAAARESEEWKGVFFVGLLAFTLAETGQALINGGGEDFLLICTIIGLSKIVCPDKVAEDTDEEGASGYDPNSALTYA